MNIDSNDNDENDNNINNQQRLGESQHRPPGRQTLRATNVLSSFGGNNGM